ncbi:HIRAN domain-containing protein [Methylobacterium sp. yr668]|uniref:HIRAN domain-containing protein n=1 Tax=Methylobacterium sp. yr668 TaxID=1761801 RepID=UPI0008EB2BC2|nr:HIRAN domain-containing protein [Methylobacterium sp. yr668]SFT27207.1 HIRAN domain-containing protein [Methylobacterium sp. yr668]
MLPHSLDGDTGTAADVPATVLVTGYDAAVEADRIRAGEPCCEAPVAGAQFYAYATEGLDGEPIRPRSGQRLNLVRDPENFFDENAVQVWLGNSTMLGHLPANVASWVAEPLDAGRPLRAYCSHPGDGTAWSLRVLLVGQALASEEQPPEEPVERLAILRVAADDDEIPF